MTTKQKKLIKFLSFLEIISYFLIGLLITDAYIYRFKFMSSYQFQFFIAPFIWLSAILFPLIKTSLNKQYKE